ncbi:response regulator transcription factor [Neptunomonas antarctica]|uniref:Two component transcriptional regulator, Fis family n=1 Tax=Neptunomonas antarctica TaxID=619304 RepID=A0A1N7J8M9_9GAMM|nr:response regulator transcription factor [Neptunomonas antarctica]SIS45669.1 two component transcriptional regulator, Fis family [Neptunomonas antarctica]
MDDQLKQFLIVDDDATFTRVLARAMAKRGFDVKIASSAEAALEIITAWIPDYVSLDLKMDGASGLTVIQPLVEANPSVRIVVLTGYASITTAVDAIKLGATQYLPKPANADDILQALEHSQANEDIDIANQPMSVNRLEWEYIHKVLSEHNGNVSATARALDMHRRTLQRKLAKRPVRQ